MRIYADAPQRNAGLFGDDGSDIGNDAYVVVSHHTQRNGVLRALRLACPACLYDAISEAFAQVACIRTVAAVYLDAAAYGYETEYLISVDRIAAACQLEVQPFQVLVDDEHVLFGGGLFGQGGSLQVIAFGAAVHDVVLRVVLPFLEFEVLVDDAVHVERFIGNALVEVRHHLEAEPFDEAHHRTLVILYFPVLELTFQCLLGKGVLAGSHFLERLPYLGARLGSGDDVQPVLLGRLCIGRHDFHLVAAVQYLLQLCVLAVYLGSYTFAAQLAVDVEGEVEHGGTLAQFEQVSLGGKDEHFVFV